MMNLAPRQKRMWVAVAAIGIAGLAWWFWPQAAGGGMGGPGAQGGPTAVEAVPVRRADLTETLVLPAQVEAVRGVTLQAEVAGKVSRLPAKEGDMVQAGEILIELDPRMVQAEVARTGAEAVLASTTLARLEAADRLGAASPLELDEARARHALARGAAMAARAKLDQHIVRAPFTGRSGLQQVVLGQAVTPGQALMNIVDDRQLRLRLTLPDQAVNQAEPGMAVELRTPTGTLTTSLTTLDSLIDPATRTRAAQIVLNRAEAESLNLQAGQFAEVALPLRLAENALVVPAMALLPGLEGARVMVVSGSVQLGQVAKAVAQPVRILARSSETVALEGLNEGQYVVVAGQHKLRGAAPEIRLVTPTAIPFIPSQAETLR